MQRISTEQLSAAERSYFAVNYETSYFHSLMIEMLAEVSVFAAIQRDFSDSKRVVSGVIHLTLRRLMSYIYGAPILDVSRSHTTTQHSR